MVIIYLNIKPAIRQLPSPPLGTISNTFCAKTYN